MREKKHLNLTGKKRVSLASRPDPAWKEIIEVLFEPFMEFFFPVIHRDIDFSKKYELLSKELRKISPDSNSGRRFSDVLIKVYLKDGSVKCIYILVHIEIQSSKDPDFMQRMYIYQYRIFDQFFVQGLEVISLAVLTDEDENYRPNEYKVSRWGFEHWLKIPLIKIIDYSTNEKKSTELEQSKNPMAMVVRVQLKSYELKKMEDNQRFDFKRELIRECYKNGYEKKQIRILLRFIDWIIRLPENLEKQISYEITKIEEAINMNYVTSWERIAKKEGKKEGMKEGKLEIARRMLSDGLPVSNVLKYTQLKPKDIESIVKS